MRIEIIQTNEITSYVGVRANSYMTNLGAAVEAAFNELINRREEIKHITSHKVTYGITPPNYKGNSGLVDFYCCYEVDPIGNLPQGMIHIHLLPRTYSVTHYKGPSNKIVKAYDYTTKWLEENGYEYDDTSYYFERYDEKTIRGTDDESSEILIYCPVKRK
ncbi:AraC family transcriptional regulator [Cohnella endophytica]|uniref:AraC family transcriptional regulator n=2 Tax=Cohnella endophytica TaxID=2419778 RepID=A0A494YCC7_9BACL|nr:AraC family transcriptional regulator [Cohnella endophytica]